MRLCFILFFWLLTHICNAQFICGKVIDNNSKNPISSANIAFKGEFSTSSTYTDSSGFFCLNTKKIGRVSIFISCMGYEFIEYNNILTSAGKQVDLFVELNSKVISLNNFTITEKVNLNSLNTKQLNIDQTNRYAGTWNDPARMAQTFAGVTSVNDESNELIIRGNSPKGLLWMIEGVEVPSPNHFSSEGASGGIISALNTATLRNSKFYTSAFPSNYSNALSGVFDVKLRAGNREKSESNININILGVNLGSEGNFNKKRKSSYLLNYRFTNTKILKEVGLVKALNVATPKFQDLTFKLNFPMKKQNLSIWGIGGNNTSEYSFDSFLDIENWANFFATGINYNRQLNKSNSLESIISFSGYEYFFEKTQKYTSQKERNFSNLAYNFIRISNVFYCNLNSNNSIQFGSVVSNNVYNLNSETNFEFNDLDIEVDLNNLSSNDNAYIVQNHFLWNYKNNKTSISSGLNNSFFMLNKKALFEPRFNLSQVLSKSFSINLGIGLHSRFEPISTYLFSNKTQINGKDVKNNNLSANRAFHKTLGLSGLLKDNLSKITIEAYHQNLFSIGVGDSLILPGSGHVSMLNELNATRLLPLLSSGKGQNFGLEISLEHDLSKGLYFNFTSSIYRSIYTVNNIDWFPSRFDNRFIFNFLIGKEFFFGNNLLNINFRSTWAGGLRTYPLVLQSTEPVYVTSMGFSNALKDYLRLDLKFNYTLNFLKTTSTFSLDFNNFINRSNPLAQIYNPIKKELETINQLGFLPMVNYRLNF